MPRRSRLLVCLILLSVVLVGCAAPSEPPAPRPADAPGLPSEPYGAVVIPSGDGSLHAPRGRLGADSRVAPGASLIADTDALSIPTFGPYLVIAGLANDWYKKLLVTGTFITRAYDDTGAANTRPELA